MSDMRQEYGDCIFHWWELHPHCCTALSGKPCKDGSVCHFYKSERDWYRDPVTGFVREVKHG